MNCGAELGVAQYCASCGQRARHRRIEFAALFQDLGEQLWEWRLPWPRTLVGLTYDAGRIARDYIAGRRMAYVNPAKYLFTMTVLGFAVTAMIPPVKGVGIGGFEIPRSSWSALFMAFGFLPIVLAVMRAWYANTGRSAAEVLVLLLYLLGHWLFMLTVVLRPAVEYLLPRTPQVDGIAAMGVWFVVLPTYVGLASRSFFEVRATRAAAGTALCMFASFAAAWVALRIHAWMFGAD